MTLFGGYSYDGLNDAIGVQHRELPNLGASWYFFLTVSGMMVSMLLQWLLLGYASDFKGSRFLLLDNAGEYIKSA